MKRIFILLLTVLTVACSSPNDKNELKQLVKTMDKACPVSINEWISMTGVKYKNDTVTMFYTVSDGIMDLDGIRANEKIFHQNMLVNYANNPDAEFKEFLQAVVKAKADLNVVFATDDGDSYTAHFTSIEIAENMPGKDTDPEKMLKTIVDNEKLQMPREVTDGVEVVDVTLDKQCLTYVYRCDEDIYDIDYMNDNTELIKSSILEELRSQNYSSTQLCKLLRTTDHILIYKYVGSTNGKTCTISITPEEL